MTFFAAFLPPQRHGEQAAGQSKDEGVMLGLSRLGKEHHHAWPFFCLDLIALFVRTVGNGKSVAGLIINRFAVKEQSVVMSAVALYMMDGDMPAIDCAVVNQGNFLPVGEAPGDFDCSRRVGLTVR